MLFTLAFAALTRHRARTILAVLGVAVSAAMLLDMVMLASGMRASFRSLLLSRGFQLRIAPKGTLPFDTEALIDSASHVRAAVQSIPGVTTVSPVLGGQLHIELAGRIESATALGVDPTVQGDYDVTIGREPRQANEMVASDELLQVIGARIGDTVRVATGFDPQLRTYVSRRPLVVVARAHFLYAAAGQRMIGVPLRTLQEMRGREATDRVSLFMVRVRDSADAERVRAQIDRDVPRVTAASIATAMKQVDERLSYFRQLAFVLGTLSLFVGFLLVTTLVSVSVNERIGEIAVLRAIGVRRGRIVTQILIEGIAIMLGGAIVGLALGLVTARYLNAILSDFPGLPAAMRFFLFEPHDAWAALALLFASGVLAGIYPSWRGASLPIATTLRQEAIA
jgi:putative ABC transport system permease protein